MAGSVHLSLRDAIPGDIRLIQELSNRIWREYYPGIIPAEQIDYMLEKMYASDVIRDDMQVKGYHYVLALDEGTAVGYLSYQHRPEGRTVFLSKIYLLPALHGRGIGKQMLERVRRDAARLGAATVHLFANKYNERAIRAYERFGFVKTEAVVTDIGGGFVMDDYQMVLTL